MKKRCNPPNFSYGGSILGSAGSMAGIGMSIGGPWGAGIGGVLGGAMGFFKEKASKQAEAEAQRLHSEQIASQQLAFNKSADRQILSSFPTNGVNSNYFAKGGNLNSQYEAEGDEVIEFSQGNKPSVQNGGKLQQTSSTTADMKGLSHEQGGMEMLGGDRIYSDQIEAPEELLKLLKLV